MTQIGVEMVGEGGGDHQERGVEVGLGPGWGGVHRQEGCWDLKVGLSAAERAEHKRRAKDRKEPPGAATPSRLHRIRAVASNFRRETMKDLTFVTPIAVDLTPSGLRH